MVLRTRLRCDPRILGHWTCALWLSLLFDFTLYSLPCPGGAQIGTIPLKSIRRNSFRLTTPADRDVWLKLAARATGALYTGSYNGRRCPHCIHRSSIAPGKPERLHGAFTARVGRSSNRGGYRCRLDDGGNHQIRHGGDEVHWTCAHVAGMCGAQGTRVQVHPAHKGRGCKCTWRTRNAGAGAPGAQGQGTRVQVHPAHKGRGCKCTRRTRDAGASAPGAQKMRVQVHPVQAHEHILLHHKGQQ